MGARTYTAAQVDAAIAALQSPDRFTHAQEVVTHAAPGLQSVLDRALADGGWFGAAHEDQLRRVSDTADAADRLRALSTLVAEETRLGMFVGVAVGFELARELQASVDESPSRPESPSHDPQES